MEPAYKIRGSLVNFVPRTAVRFKLMSGEEEVSASRVSVNGDTGVFEIQDVVPGAYTLYVTQDKTSAEVPVMVGGADLDRLVVTLSSGVDLETLTRFANEGEGGACGVSLRPTGGRGGTIHRARSPQRMAPQGAAQQPSLVESTIAGVPPGPYRVVINCNGAYVHSAAMGSQDLLANPVLTVQPGVQTQPIQVLAVRGGGSVTGTVSGDNQPTAGVLLVPQFESTGPVAGEASRDNEEGEGLQFEFESLAPGAYLAYAFPNMDDLEYRNPEFLKTLSGGVSVQVEDGAEKKIALPVASQ
jgi:hypothetical protein